MESEMIALILKGTLLVLAPIGFYFGIIKPNIHGYKNRRQPTITIPATIVGKEQNLDNVIYSGSAARFSGTVHYLTFKTKDGLLVTLTVPRDDYYNLKEGTTGTLTYQGTKCERFDPDK